MTDMTDNNNPNNLTTFEQFLKENGVTEAEIQIILELGAENTEDLKLLTANDFCEAGIPKVRAKKIAGMLGQAISAGAESQYQLSILPSVPDDNVLSEALCANGELKSTPEACVAAVHSAFADYAGLFEVPSKLIKEMEIFAETAKEPLSEGFFELSNEITKQRHAPIFNSLTGAKKYVTAKTRKIFSRTARQKIWPGLRNGFEATKAWYESYMAACAANAPLLMGAAISGGAIGNNFAVALPDTAPVKDAARSLNDAFNATFAGTGFVTSAAMSFDAARIKGWLKNPDMPALIGMPNREMMLEKLGVAVPEEYVRTEENLSRFTMALLNLENVTADQEPQYLTALFQLGNAINWQLLSSRTSGLVGVTGEEI